MPKYYSSKTYGFGLYVFRRVRKIATVSFVMTVRPYVTTRLPRHGFSWNFIFEYFSKL